MSCTVYVYSAEITWVDEWSKQLKIKSELKTLVVHCMAGACRTYTLAVRVSVTQK